MRKNNIILTILFILLLASAVFMFYLGEKTSMRGTAAADHHEPIEKIEKNIIIVSK